ncbi:hypothetical protein [Aliarcobacter cryaerophilus]|uniref:Uncharacterized protein n=1 Tax=Aliarcobacter cryaerophilus TaxID=28198 RepID=A0AA46NBM3_9BACT|nr:hypothetical protein [Aliarcobacter cryaerophilus]UYF42557.1 hypothetical protein NGX11_06495 [Aliarcobacter cryaerophilus]
MSKRILKFDDRVDNLLQELKQELKMPINKIITMIINEKLEDIKRLKKETVEDLKFENTQKETEIRFRIFEKEKIFLEEQIKKNGNSSLTSEIRFRLLNSIYKNKYFLPIELTEFKNLVYQIKMIGLNINGIFKRVNFKEELKSEDYINLQNSINEVNEKIDLINNEMKSIFKSASYRD